MKSQRDLDTTGLRVGVGGDTAGDRSLAMLLTSAGRRVGLLQCFRQSATELGLDLTVMACDLSPQLSAACQLADASFAVPRASDPHYADRILDLCIEKGIRLVVPTIDTELMALSAARDRFAQCGIWLSVSAPQLTAIARDKLTTAQFLASHDVPVPRTMALEAVLEQGWAGDWPVMVKPRHGSSSRGIYVATSPEGLDIRPSEPMIVQQLLQGAEYTVNMFFDGKGQVRAVIPHERLQVRAGEVEKGVTRRVADIERLAQQVATCLPEPRGTLCFQAMRDASGVARLFEINPRFGGGFPLADHAGGRFARWLLEEVAGLASTASNNWKEGVMMLRYDAAIYSEA